MNYIELWIGDIGRKTAHLSAEKVGIYLRILLHLYATETALPEDHETIERVAQIHGERERKALESLLADPTLKWVREGGTLMQQRALEEIAKRREYIAGQRVRAQTRWKRERTAETVDPETGEIKQASHKGNGAAFHLPEWIKPDLWAAWLKIRPAKARTPAAQAAAVVKLEKMRSAGHDANSIVENSLANGWQGLFAPDGKTARSGLHERNQEAAAQAVRKMQEEEKRVETEDFSAFSRMIALTAEQYGRAMSPELIRFYFDGLSHLPLAAIRLSLNSHVRNTEVGQFMPKVADIVRGAEGGSDAAELRALALVQDTMERHGAYASVRFADTSINAVINDMGGWVALCRSDSEEWHKFKSREFMRRYRLYRQSGDFNAPGYLPGYFEIANVANGYSAKEPILIGSVAPRIERKT